jgi:hypothetical protein
MRNWAVCITVLGIAVVGDLEGRAAGQAAAVPLGEWSVVDENQAGDNPVVS